MLHMRSVQLQQAFIAQRGCRALTFCYDKGQRLA